MVGTYPWCHPTHCYSALPVSERWTEWARIIRCHLTPWTIWCPAPPIYINCIGLKKVRCLYSTFVFWRKVTQRQVAYRFAPFWANLPKSVIWLIYWVFRVQKMTIFLDKKLAIFSCQNGQGFRCPQNACRCRKSIGIPPSSSHLLDLARPDLGQNAWLSMVMNNKTDWTIKLLESKTFTYKLYIIYYINKK